MAIKVNGTTVINDSRALQNVASVDATTAAAITAGGVGGGHWAPLSEVTLGGSGVSAIDITLPSGYDKHRLDFVLPAQPSGAAGTALWMQFLDSGNTAQRMMYSSMYSGYPVGRIQHEDATSMYLVPDVGDFIVGSYKTYVHGVLEILDANSSSFATRYLASVGAAAEANGEPLSVTAQGKQTTGVAATSSKVRFKWQNSSNFDTGSGYYYRLYGHSYS